MDLKPIVFTAAVLLNLTPSFASFPTQQDLEAEEPYNPGLSPRSGMDEDAIRNIVEFIAEADANAKQAKDQDVVLVLGNTGAGKSTIINYLLGSKMQRIETDSGNIAEPIDRRQEWAKIGNTAESETFLPAVYSTPSSPLAYCDCPGFGDNRGEDMQVKASIATQIAINYAKSIQSIMVVIDVNELTVGRGKNMRDISLTLNHLLKPPINPNSLLFVFNNKTSSAFTLEGVIKKISEIRTAESKKLITIPGFEKKDKKKKKEYDNAQRIITILDMMTAQKQNMFLINIFDELKSREKAVDLLYRLDSTAKDQFNFSAYDDSRVQFDMSLFKAVADISGNLKAFAQAVESLEINKERLEGCDQRIGLYQTQLATLNPTDEAEHVSKIAALEPEAKEYEKKIASLKGKRKIHQAKITELEKEAKKINTNEKVVYWKDSIDQKRLFLLGKLSWTKKVFNYKGIPFAEKKSWCENGKFKKEDLDKDKGIYKGTYVSDWGKNGHAYVEILVEEKNKPDNQLRFEEIAQDLDEEKSAIEKYDSEIKSAERAFKNIKELVEYHGASKQSKRKLIEGRKRALEEEIARVEREKKELLSETNKKKDIRDQAELSINSRKGLIDSVYNLVAGGLGYNSDLIEEFKMQYNRYNAFMTSMAAPLSPSLEDDRIFQSLICPLTCDIFIDAVITKCGHTFSHYALSQALSVNNKCPTCREVINEIEDLRPNYNVRQLVAESEAKRFEQAKQSEDSIFRLNMSKFKQSSLEEKESILQSISKEMKQISGDIEQKKRDILKKENDLRIMEKTYAEYEKVFQKHTNSPKM